MSQNIVSLSGFY